jgi:hypothetical protein
MRSVLKLAALAAVLATATSQGCAHPCGYADVRVTWTLRASGQMRQADRQQLLIVLRHPSVEDPRLVVSLSKALVVEREVLRQFSGIEVVVPYHWSALVVKPILPFTLVLAVWMPFDRPHSHDAGIWGMGDYLRDFVAWFNLFEAFPNGKQEASGNRVVFRTEKGWQPTQRLASPMSGARIQVLAAGQPVASLTTDAEGNATVDLRALARRIPARAETVLTLQSEGAARRVVLDRALVSSLQKVAKP